MKNGKWIVLLGVPGCGKGTQCELLKNSNLDFKVICVGDVLRSNNSMLIPQLGKTVSEILGRGILLPDDAIIDLVKSELSKMSNVKNHNLIFDGFPRTIGQAEALTKVASDFNQKISYALSFDIPDDLLIKRITGRYSCKNCGKIYNDYFFKPEKEGVCDICGSSEFNRRKDDNENSLSVRLGEYHSKTQPLIDFYKNQGVIYSINADRNASDIHNEILSILKS